MVCFAVGLLLSFSRFRIEEFLPDFKSLVKKTSDPKEVMLCKDSGQLVIA